MIKDPSNDFKHILNPIYICMFFFQYQYIIELLLKLFIHYQLKQHRSAIELTQLSSQSCQVLRSREIHDWCIRVTLIITSSDP
jgi:hypothetical protein